MQDMTLPCIYLFAQKWCAAHCQGTWPGLLRWQTVCSSIVKVPEKHLNLNCAGSSIPVTSVSIDWTTSSYSAICYDSQILFCLSPKPVVKERTLLPAETPISSEPLMVPISVLIPSLTNSGSEQKYFQRKKNELKALECTVSPVPSGDSSVLVIKSYDYRRGAPILK